MSARDVGGSGAEREAGRAGAPRPGRFDPAVHAIFSRALSPLARALWPADVTGLEHLPDHDRYMIVANHSGLGSAELFSLLVWWTDRFGDARPLSGMAHPAGFRLPHLRPLLHAYGAVHATREGAAWARARSAPLLVFPGGDREALRPLRRAREVDFFGRMGWIRLAREHGLCVVPMCITNSHHTLPLLPVAPELAAWLTGLRLLGVRRAPLPAHGVLLGALAGAALRRLGLGWGASALGGLATLLTTGMVPVVPARIGFHLHAPLEPGELEASDPAVYDRVLGALRATMVARTGGA